jgi:DNA-binding MarR family transcriptional regulator
VAPSSRDAIAEARRQWEARGMPQPAAMAAATSVMRAQQLVLAAVDAALKPHGLTFARYEVLVLLSFTRQGALPLGKIGDRLMVHPASVTNAIDRLEAAGFVRRVPHPSDRRATLAEITEQGRQVVAEATDSVAAAGFGLDGLDEAQLDAVYAALNDLRRATGDLDQPT